LYNSVSNGCIGCIVHCACKYRLRMNADADNTYQEKINQKFQRRGFLMIRAVAKIKKTDRK